MSYLKHGSSAYILFAIVYLICCEESHGLLHQEDICRTHNGHRLYIELGENGILTAENIRNSDISTLDISSYNRCSLELSTCLTCTISLKFHYLNLTMRCKQNIGSGHCPCDVLWISEPPYTNVSALPFCGMSMYYPASLPPYKSQTHTVKIELLYTESYRHAFTLEYLSQRNRQVYVGSPRTAFTNQITNFHVSSTGVIKSPFFPLSYPRDIGMEYFISCRENFTKNCHVSIVFRDFLIDQDSIIEFFDSNGQRLEVTSGAFFRPPVILTVGSSLLIRFYANGGTALGFKAVYSFISGDSQKNTMMPNTDCGGFVENLGGAITMMNMVKDGVILYDCIWLIQPSRKFFHFKTHLYLKVVTFTSMANDTEMKVQQGLTSEQPVLEILHPLTQSFTHKEHVIPVTDGFYVSLKGTFHSSSRLSIVYTAFSYLGCFADSDFLCKNHRCIPSQLQCDGFDHCGDNSDESEMCSKGKHEQQWYSLAPNYYFPKITHYPDLKTAAIVFLIGSTGLIMLIAALMVLLHRIGSRTRQQRELQEQLRSISDFLDGSFHDDTPPDDPPVYEEPPSYNEIINVFVEEPKDKKYCKIRQELLNQLKYQHLTGTLVNSRTSLNSSCNSVQEVNRFSLVVPAGTSDMLDLKKHLAIQVQNRNRSCQTTPIPNSPPPPYTADLLFFGRNSASLGQISYLTDADVNNLPMSQDFENEGTNETDVHEQLAKDVESESSPTFFLSDNSDLLLEVAESLIFQSSSNNFKQNESNSTVDKSLLQALSAGSNVNYCFMNNTNNSHECTANLNENENNVKKDTKMIDPGDNLLVSNIMKKPLISTVNKIDALLPVQYLEANKYTQPVRYLQSTQNIFLHHLLNDSASEYKNNFLAPSFEKCVCEGACGCANLYCLPVHKKTVFKKKPFGHSSSNALMPLSRSFSDSGLQCVNIFRDIRRNRCDNNCGLRHPVSLASDINKLLAEIYKKPWQ